MSHFSALVIGDNVEGQLAPYDENLEVEPYKERLDAEGIASMAKHYGFDPSDTAAILANTQDWYGREGGVDDDGVFTLTTRNQRAKWDWYSVGGRWTGHLILKPGATGTVGEPGLMTDRAPAGTADVARKGDVDFEAMKLDYATKAADRFDRYAALAAEHDPALPFSAIEGEIEHRRKVYWDQPLIQALTQARLLGIEADITEFDVGREPYIEAAALRGPTTYAMVAEGAWKAKGEMGWFGMSHDETDPDAWVKFWWQMVDGLPDDTILTVVDLHI